MQPNTYLLVRKHGNLFSLYTTHSNWIDIDPKKLRVAELVDIAAALEFDLTTLGKVTVLFFADDLAESAKRFGFRFEVKE